MSLCRNFALSSVFEHSGELRFFHHVNILCTVVSIKLEVVLCCAVLADKEPKFQAAVTFVLFKTLTVMFVAFGLTFWHQNQLTIVRRALNYFVTKIAHEFV